MFALDVDAMVRLVYLLEARCSRKSTTAKED